ncbi:MAG TPA: Ku protein [Gemmatimonadaceae bacterium]|nr:Ku protein [Gemmatimonadaceae bacterium]
MWTGEIQFGSVKLPVKLYSAVKDKSIHFRILDAKKHEPVKQHMVDAASGTVVEYHDARRAVQVGKNRLVILDEDELESLEPESSREIEITRFVSPDAITHQWYDRPYYLGPNGDTGTYFALVQALRDQGKEGVARWVMRNKEYVGALRVEGDHLMLMTLRHADEVIPASSLPAPGGRDVSKRELEMAHQLVETMVDEFKPAAYRDEYRDRVLELVDAKAKGKVLRMPKAKAKKTPASLESVLEKSIAAASRGRKSA